MNIEQKLEQAMREIAALTEIDPTPGLHYVAFFSDTMGCDLTAGAAIHADCSDDAGAYWSVEVCEIWMGAVDVTTHLKPETLAAVTGETHAHLHPEMTSPEAIKRAGRLARVN